MGIKNDVNITQLVNQYTNELLSWASYKVSDTELAKDLVQDTFLVAVEKIDSFKGDSSPKTWLFSILKYKIIDYYRVKVKKPFSYEKQNYFLEKAISQQEKLEQKKLEIDVDSFKKSILEKIEK